MKVLYHHRSHNPRLVVPDGMEVASSALLNAGTSLSVRVHLHAMRSRRFIT